VRNALLLVARSEAPAGIVYATDAAVSSNVMIAGVFPESSHDRITYPFAVIRAGDTPEARALLAYLAGPEGHATSSSDAGSPRTKLRQPKGAQRSVVGYVRLSTSASVSQRPSGNPLPLNSGRSCLPQLKVVSL